MNLQGPIMLKKSWRASQRAKIVEIVTVLFA